MAKHPIYKILHFFAVFEPKVLVSTRTCSTSVAKCSVFLNVLKSVFFLLLQTVLSCQAKHSMYLGYFLSVVG